MTIVQTQRWGDIGKEPLENPRDLHILKRIKMCDEKWIFSRSPNVQIVKKDQRSMPVGKNGHSEHKVELWGGNSKRVHFRQYIYIYIYIYKLLFKVRIRYKVNFYAAFKRFEFRVFLLNWLSNHGQITQSIQLFTHIWRKNNCINTFPKGISDMWNAMSFV